MTFSLFLSFCHFVILSFFSYTDIHRKETVRMEMSTIVESEMERQQN